jgi:hypothetical protein
MTTKTKTPTKVDLRIAEELDRLAAEIDPKVPHAEMCKLDDLQYGQVIAREGVAIDLRRRAADIRSGTA